MSKIDLVLGAKYRFVIEGTVISDPAVSPVQVQDDDGTIYEIDTYIDAAPIIPDNWPPAGGDVWQDRDGGLWVVYAEEQGRYIHLLSAIGGAKTSTEPDEFLEMDIGPVLVYRQGVIP